MNKYYIIAILFLALPNMGFGQDADFEPGGKPILRIFSNYHTTFSNGESSSAFDLTRVYLGYEHRFSKNLSGTAILDVGDPGVGKLQMTAYVKNAYLAYNTGNFTVNFGMISTTQFKVQESAWGYRYLEKSFQDAYKFNASADLGISAAYKFNDYFSADVILANGEGYKKLDADSTLRAGAGLTIKPLKNITGRVYYDYSNRETAQQSVAAFLGYDGNSFSVGAEYVMQVNNEFTADHTLSGMSFYSTVYTSDKTRVFARYDRLGSNLVQGDAANWNLENDGQLFILGFEYAPAKGVKLAPNFKGWLPENSGEAFVASIMLNCELKF